MNQSAPKTSASPDFTDENTDNILTAIATSHESLVDNRATLKDIHAVETRLNHKFGDLKTALGELKVKVSHLASKADLIAAKAELAGEMHLVETRLGGEMPQVETRIRGEMHQTEIRLIDEMRQVETRFMTELHKTTFSMIRWMVGVAFAQTALILSLLTWLIKGT